MADDETFACEACNAVTPDGDGIMHGDVTVCPACSADLQAQFAACDHSWEPCEGEWGPGQCCTQCGGFVLDDDFAAMFPDTPTPDAAR